MAAGDTLDASPGAATWRLWVDTGGTFTDCVALDPNGAAQRIKVLSSSALRGVVLQRLEARRLRLDLPYSLPDGFLTGAVLVALDLGARATIEHWSASGEARLASSIEIEEGQHCEIRTAEEAPTLAARLATGTPFGRALPPIDMRLATTRATNALLERSGGPIALFITRGFADLLEIGTQQRSDLFVLEIEKRRPLYAEVVEVDERLGADGSLLRPLNEDTLVEAADALVSRGVTSAAVALLHSFRDDRHERAARDVLSRRGFRHVSCSAELAPLIRLLPRAETAVVDAYLAGVIETYLRSVEGAMSGGHLRVMTSAGGLASSEGFRPKESLLSGPAGGVVGAAHAGAESGRQRLISFDMGGTSTDVARYDGDFDYQFETRVGEARILAPALAIETVAAGGGSICRFDGRQLKVGPESAGAEPGPACYGAGGPLTLTDVNLLLGRLDPDHFELPLVTDAAAEALEGVLAALEPAGMGLSREEALLGFLSIANERMAEAIRRISVRKGYDPASYTLVGFGGAGAQHALALADLLGIDSVLVPKDASLLSACGLGHAMMERFVERQVLTTAPVYERRVGEELEQLGREARDAVAGQGVPRSDIEVRRRLLSLRLVGQESTLDVEYDEGRSIVELFREAYSDRFGYAPPDRQVEVESVRVVASARAGQIAVSRRVEPFEAAPAGSRRCLLAGVWQEVPLFERQGLEPGAECPGPALVVERFTATVVEPEWRCRVEGHGGLRLDREVNP